MFGHRFPAPLRSRQDTTAQHDTVKPSGRRRAVRWPPRRPVAAATPPLPRRGGEADACSGVRSGHDAAMPPVNAADGEMIDMYKKSHQKRCRDGFLAFIADDVSPFANGPLLDSPEEGVAALPCSFPQDMICRFVRARVLGWSRSDKFRSDFLLVCVCSL